MSKLARKLLQNFYSSSYFRHIACFSAHPGLCLILRKVVSPSFSGASSAPVGNLNCRTLLFISRGREKKTKNVFENVKKTAKLKTYEYNGFLFCCATDDIKLNPLQAHKNLLREIARDSTIFQNSFCSLSTRFNRARCLIV